MPFISGISQSMMYALYSSFCSAANFVLRTASFPSVVQSGRMPITLSIICDTHTGICIIIRNQRSKALQLRNYFRIFIVFHHMFLNSRVTTNSVPLSTSLYTSIVPPIISTMFFVMDIPSPVPWIPLTVEVRSLSNGSKICFINS